MKADKLFHVLVVMGAASAIASILAACSDEADSQEARDGARSTGGRSPSEGGSSGGGAPTVDASAGSAGSTGGAPASTWDAGYTGGSASMAGGPSGGAAGDDGGSVLPSDASSAGGGTEAPSGGGAPSSGGAPAAGGHDTSSCDTACELAGFEDWWNCNGCCCWLPIGYPASRGSRICGEEPCCEVDGHGR